MPSTPFGDQLKRERELRGVSLEEVATATRIAPRFLEALENEQWEKLPGGVFNRGFIRSVARYLGLDEDNLVSEYALQTKGRTEPGVVPDAPMKQESMWGRIATLVIVLLLAIAAIAAAVHYLGPMLMTRLHHGPTQVSSSASLNKPNDPSSTPFAPTAGIDPTDTAAAPLLALKVTVLKPTKLTVLVDGKDAFTGASDLNDTKVFSAHTSIDFLSSVSDAVTLELNGQPVTSAATAGQPLHRTFTPGDVKSDATVNH
jgi:transcriptional regulator with XRE-family HTH domain